ncbi:uncharacterized protein LOC141679206 [Apium graveolens]|uniref:uncharacterized protein LOC141679206 n=1 Tax=Apium graveolens TaxID=4045 RepID=UPI003D7985E5
MKDLRPIALCNVLYKIIAKVLSNSLRVILPGIISENQSAFVPARAISDNVLVAFEILHHMKQKARNREGGVDLKLDVSKAYNRIGPITPLRGLRQGDPLSPYLFLFCVEGLSSALRNAVDQGKITGCKIHQQAPAVTHLFFADESFLFYKASLEEVREIKRILQQYEQQSGQAINFQKFGIYFSANVRVDKQVDIKSFLEVHNNLSTGRYLGLPSLIGRSKKQAVPTYAMSCFILPKSLCKELKKIMNSFWWGSSGGGSRGIKWLSWSNMCMSKGSGSLGLRDMLGFNLALLGKHCYKLWYDNCGVHLLEQNNEGWKKLWNLERLAVDDKEKLVLIATGLWGIWSARNMKVGENKVMTPELAMQWSTLQVGQWRDIQRMRSNRANTRRHDQQRIVNHWIPPVPGALKVNVDASVIPGSSSFKLGMVLRDHEGRFCKARNMCKVGEVPVHEAEAEGVLEALKWVLELGVSNITVESDSLITVQALSKGSQNYLEVGNILQECRNLVDDRPDLTISFVKRQANVVAHLLAQMPCKTNSSNDFLFPPQMVLESIVYDALAI